jgi:hypothetical protein
LLTEVDFRGVAAQASDDWLWWATVGGQADLDTTLTGLRQELATMVRFG